MNTTHTARPAAEFNMPAAISEFHTRVRAGESMADAFNEITDRIEPGKLSNWNVVEEFGRHVGYQPWKRIL